MSELLTQSMKVAVNLGTKSSRINSYTPQQKRAQQILTTSLCAMSLIIAFVTLYLIAHAHRSFRHTLILLLLISQLCKVVWLGIYSTYKISQGLPDVSHGFDAPMKAPSQFCHVDGFWVAFGTDGADFVVFLIALHTVLTIFKPGRHLGKGGLYPYRLAAYIAWVVYPALMASLAFINGKNSYLEQGAFCALPIRPFWFRLALAWIPRYIILSFILIVYTGVYVYASYKFSKAESQGTSTLLDSSNIGVRQSYRASDSNPSTLVRRHRAIKRQLQFMFIYPVVYLILWILPFVSHCYGYTDKQTPFGVSTAALLSSTLQCAADCTVFIVREKPWRRMDTAWVPSRRVTQAKQGPKQDREMVLTREKTRTKSIARQDRSWWDVEISRCDRGDEDGELPGSEARRARLESYTI